MMLLNPIVIVTILFSTDPFGLEFYLWLAGWLLLATIIVLMIDKVIVIDATD